MNPARRLVLSQTITGFTPPSKKSGEAFEPRGGIMPALLELPLNALDKAFAGHFLHLVEPNEPVRLLEVRLLEVRL